MSRLCESVKLPVCLCGCVSRAVGMCVTVCASVLHGVVCVPTRSMIVCVLLAALVTATDCIYALHEVPRA
jgi:hypothetical protein